MGRGTKLDRLFDPIDNALYLLIGRKVTSQAMDWKAYTFHMLATNLVMALIIFLILSFQDYLPLNQLGTSRGWSQCKRSIRRSVSSPTPTGRATAARRRLSNFSQMGGDHVPDVHLGDDGLRRRDGVHPRLHGSQRRRRSRQLLPGPHPLHYPRADAVCFVIALSMIAQGAAADPRRERHRAHRCKAAEQTIAVGPVASQETIKHHRHEWRRLLQRQRRPSVSRTRRRSPT